MGRMGRWREDGEEVGKDGERCGEDGRIEKGLWEELEGRMGRRRGEDEEEVGEGW